MVWKQPYPEAITDVCALSLLLMYFHGLLVSLDIIEQILLAIVWVMEMIEFSVRAL